MLLAFAHGDLFYLQSKIVEKYSVITAVDHVVLFIKT